MSNRLCLFVSAGLIAPTLLAFAETQCGDITAAVREFGQSPSLSATPEGHPTSSDGVGVLFDGLCGYSDAGYSPQRFLSASGTTRQAVEYAIPEAFLPGESVVVTGVVFSVGPNGEGKQYKSYDLRMPSAWTLEGRNDSGTDEAGWTAISSVSGFSDYRFNLKKGSASIVDDYAATITFANWTSFRRYRVVITANTGDTAFLVQLSEIKFLGLYGGNVVQPEPQEIDITAACREAGDKRTISSNLEAHSQDYGLERLFNGVVYSDRFLATADSTAAALADEGALISYEIPDDVLRNADIVLTGYRIEMSKAFSITLERLPMTFALEGFDSQSGSWVELDGHQGFALYETVKESGNEELTYTFRFRNSISCRRYRLRVRELVGPFESSACNLQMSEIRLLGYADVNLAGRTLGTIQENAIDITGSGRDGRFTPIISNSTCTVLGYGVVLTNLFDGDYSSRYLATVEGHLPYDIYYEIPETFMPGEDFLVDGYSIFTSTEFNSYRERLPKTWRLQCHVPEADRWVTVARSTDFADWETSESKIFKAFGVEKRYASRRYRLRIFDTQGTTASGRQVQLTELEFRGCWGKGIGEKFVRKGFVLILR